MSKKVSQSFGMLILFWVINLLVLFPSRVGFAQDSDTLWTRRYGGDSTDVGYSVQQTSDGGYIIAGYTQSFGAGNWDVYLIRADTKGDILWTKTYGGIDSDVAFLVRQTSDGGYIIAGRTESFGTGGDVYLIRTDAKGDTLWTKTYGGIENDGGGAVQQTSDEGYIITGFTYSFSVGFGDVYLIKTDTKGDTHWTKTYGGGGEDWGTSVQQTSDGGYIIAGFTWSFGTGDNWDVYLIRTDAKGDTLWTKTYGGRWDDIGLSVQQTTDEGHIVAGATYSFGAGKYDVHLIKTDAEGDTLWTKTYGGEGDDFGYSVQQTSDEGYIIAGSTSSFSAGDTNVYLIKTDARGDILWTKIYGGTDLDWGTSVQQTSDGGYIIAGGTASFSGGYSDVYLIKMGPETNIEERESFQETFFLQSEPNPFSERTTIRYTIPDAGYKPQNFSLMVYDISGRVVRDLTNNLASCIKNHISAVSWEGRDNYGKKIPSGVYFLRFEAGRFKTTRKLLIMR